jgi:hypothetical protein
MASAKPNLADRRTTRRVVEKQARVSCPAPSLLHIFCGPLTQAARPIGETLIS